MKALYLSALIVATISTTAIAQQEEVEEVVTEEQTEPTPPDTTRIKIGKKEVIIIGEDSEENFEDDFEPEQKPEKKHFEGHWAGLEFGFTSLMNSNFESRFPTAPYWQNDAAKSQVWNLNLVEH